MLRERWHPHEMWWFVAAVCALAGRLLAVAHGRGT